VVPDSLVTAQEGGNRTVSPGEGADVKIHALLRYPPDMFTGLIAQMGTVAATGGGEAAIALRIDPEGWGHVPELGSSISVNGCCLTVVNLEDGQLLFDVVEQTCDRTSIGALQVGDRVNLEHAATPTSLLGGHIVQGHVDCVGVVEANGDQGERGWRLQVRYPASFRAMVVEQGSITVQGVSLTIASDRHDVVELALIPETLQRTTLGGMTAGDSVNVEFDLFAKLVQRQLSVR